MFCGRLWLFCVLFWHKTVVQMRTKKKKNQTAVFFFALQKVPPYILCRPRARQKLFMMPKECYIPQLMVLYYCPYALCDGPSKVHKKKLLSCQENDLKWTPAGHPLHPTSTTCIFTTYIFLLVSWFNLITMILPPQKVVQTTRLFSPTH